MKGNNIRLVEKGREIIFIETAITIFPKMCKIHTCVCKIGQNSLITIAQQNLKSKNDGGQSSTVKKTLHFLDGRCAKFEIWCANCAKFQQNYDQFHIQICHQWETNLTDVLERQRDCTDHERKDVS